MARPIGVLEGGPAPGRCPAPPLPCASAARQLATCACQPLRLLHRDIKPSNLHLTAQGEVKLLDFGVARADFANREAETRSLMFGTANYMAPERMDFIDGPAGDIYSLGAVLFELLTGEAFGRTSSNQSRHQQRLHGRLTDAWYAIDEPDEDLVRFVGDLLAFSPEARPSARDVERRCDDLGRRLGKRRLRDWAESVVPELLATREPLPVDDFSGSTLMETFDSNSLDTGGQDATSLKAVTAAHPWAVLRKLRLVRARVGKTPLLLAGLAVTLLGGVCVTLLGGVWLVDGSDPAPITRPTPLELIAPLVTEPAPDLPIEEVDEVESEAPAEPTPVDGSRQPAKRVARDRALDHAPATGNVRVRGDALSVRLSSGSRTWPPGAVPAGRYDVLAEFPGRGQMGAGEVTVSAGASVSLECIAAFTLCRVE